MECFFERYQHTIQALGALGTLLAVIVAVYLARASKQIKLKSNASIWVVYGENIPDAQRQRSIQVSITNVGAQSVWLHWLFFNWRFPFDKTNAGVNPINPEQFPKEIPVNRNVLIPITPLATFRQEMIKITSHLKWGKALRLRYCRAYIYTEDGKKFRVYLAPNIRKELINLSKQIP